MWGPSIGAGQSHNGDLSNHVKSVSVSADGFISVEAVGPPTISKVM